MKSLVALAFVLATLPAKAAPSVWERARNVRAAHSERVLVRLERVFDGVSQSEGDADMMRDFRQGTLVVAEMSGVRGLDDARLTLLLAQALIGLDSQVEAASLLEQALARMEPQDAWLEAELRPLLALTELRDPARAERLLTRALGFAWQPALRSTLLRRRADARMAVLEVRGSQRDAAAALGSAVGVGQRVSAEIALGLALERAGDEPAAFRELGYARALSLANPEEIGFGLDDLFLLRPLDAEYAAALIAMESALASEQPEAQLDQYQRALRAWAAYLERAPSDDRFRGNALGQLRRCEKARHALSRSAP
ncbi:MAG: hypothetical protein QM756_15730 [Polyangiaceae bacterium]